MLHEADYIIDKINAILSILYRPAPPPVPPLALPIGGNKTQQVGEGKGKGKGKNNGREKEGEEGEENKEVEGDEGEEGRGSQTPKKMKQRTLDGRTLLSPKGKSKASQKQKPGDDDDFEMPGNSKNSLETPGSQKQKKRRRTGESEEDQESEFFSETPTRPAKRQRSDAAGEDPAPCVFQTKYFLKYSSKFIFFSPLVLFFHGLTFFRTSSISNPSLEEWNLSEISLDPNIEEVGRRMESQARRYEERGRKEWRKGDMGRKGRKRGQRVERGGGREDR
jgi:hypothetical protein